MSSVEQFRDSAQECFPYALAGKHNILSLAHSDVDGIASAAILARALKQTGREVTTLITGKGENPWSATVSSRLAAYTPDLLFVSDLGSREKPILSATPAVLIDHHRPLGAPPGAVLVSGYGVEPTPTSGLIAFWCVSALGEFDDLAWIAGLSVIADLGDEALLDLLPITRQEMKSTIARDAISLLNAARRSAAGDATPALSLLLKSNSPRQITSGEFPETAQLRAMREQVQAELMGARKLPPKFPPKSEKSAPVVIITMHSACQIHPLIAQQWRGRFKDRVVIAANTGYRPGFVHFSARSASDDLNLLDFLRDYAPSDTDESYGNGHNRASGGALTYPAWNEFVAKLGYGPEMQLTLAA
ncbi:MAG TPA: DHH family phosphoesterase [Terriglobales bacterium]